MWRDSQRWELSQGIRMEPVNKVEVCTKEAVTTGTTEDSGEMGADGKHQGEWGWAGQS